MNKSVIIINPFCHQGKGWKRWLSVRDEVRKRFPFACEEIVLEKGVNLAEALPPLVLQNEKTCLVSAGGDGSVHYLVNCLMAMEQKSLTRIVLGAVGLGSSNDFLKPFGEKISNVPVRIHCGGGSFLHDLGRAVYSNETKTEKTKHFLVNASLGVTAQANWNFNHPGPVLRFLKKYFTGAAIGYTAVSTILRHTNQACRVAFQENEVNAPVSNVNVLKVPHVSGSFFYDQSICRDDGRLGLNVCMNMSKAELLNVLTKLQKGRFPLSEKTISVFVPDVSFSASWPFVFECDGETEKATSLRLSVLPNVLPVLKS